MVTNLLPSQFSKIEETVFSFQEKPISHWDPLTYLENIRPPIGNDGKKEIKGEVRKRKC